MIDRSRAGARRGKAAVVAVILLLVLGAGIWLVVRRMRSAPPSPDDGRNLAASFLEQLRTQQIDAAWNGTTAEFKSLMGLEYFKGYVKAHPELREPAEFAEYAVVERNGLKMGECTFRPGSPQSATISVLLAREDGVWKVERLAVE